MTAGRVEVHQVDVFTQSPFEGNPAAVVPEAGGLSDAQMQAIAREMNLSETAFVFPKNAAGEIPVRFFTPSKEVPLCGHATLAAHYVLATRAGGSTSGEVAQRSPGGRWQVRWEERDGRLFMTMLQGPIEYGGILAGEVLRRLSDALGVGADAMRSGWPVQEVSTGHSKMVVPITDSVTLSSIRPDMDALVRLSEDIGVGGYFLFALGGKGVDTVARMFGPAIGVPEDPVNGSGHGPLAAYLAEREPGVSQLVDRGFWSGMGDHLGRPGRVWVRRHSADTVAVGGHVSPVFSTSIPRPAVE